MRIRGRNRLRVLALDSTSSRESVALVEDGRLLGEVRLCRLDAHSRRLLPAVAFLLESLRLAAADVDGFAVALGPGSFTGLRVGISTVQGLGLGTGRPCLGVSALDALGALGAGEGREVAAWIDAQRGEVYTALYDPQGRPRGPARRETPEQALERVAPDALFVGDGVACHHALLARLRPGAACAEREPFLAASVARLGLARLRDGEAGRPADLRPLYLREAHIRGSHA